MTVLSSCPVCGDGGGFHHPEQDVTAHDGPLPAQLQHLARRPASQLRAERPKGKPSDEEIARRRTAKRALAQPSTAPYSPAVAFGATAFPPVGDVVTDHMPVGDQSLPCLAKGETEVDGALLPVACDLWDGHDRTHWDERVFTFWAAGGAS